MGPQDFVITDNIILNNGQSRWRQVIPHLLPSGICLFNAQGCVIANNRCMDDQDRYAPSLAAGVKPGASWIPMKPEPVHGFVYPMFYETVYGTGRNEGQVDLYAVVSDGSRRERVFAEKLRYKGEEKKWGLVLRSPLASSFPEDATVTPENTQTWGIFVGGPRAEGNVIANNVCAGNAAGGILWSGKDTIVSGNTGNVEMLDEGSFPADKVFPASATVTLGNAGFEGTGGWKPGPGVSFDNVAHTGRRALKMAKESGGSVEVVSDAISLKPVTWYRLSAWVRTDARRGEGTALPAFRLGAPGRGNLVSNPEPMVTPRWAECKS